jgi:dTDP-4-amino-4,6-dideoxygalactose transaminase
MVHYPICLHNQPCFKHYGYANGDFPIAEKQANTELSLPLFYGISNNEIDLVSEILLQIVNSMLSWDEIFK